MTWIIAILVIVSVELAAHKRIENWFVSIAAQVLNIILAIQYEFYGYIVMSIVLILQSIRGIILWRKYGNSTHHDCGHNAPAVRPPLP